MKNSLTRQHKFAFLTSLGLAAVLVGVTACGGGDDTAITTTDTTAATTTTASTATTACSHAAAFPDVSLTSNYIDWNGDGAAPAITPSVSVTCSDGVVSVVSNGVPNFDAIGNGRGGVDAAYQTNQQTWKFPSSPAKAATTTATTLGAIGVLVNGVQFYNPTDGDGADAYAGGLLNYCNGHTEQYHFHGYPTCFFSKNTVGTTHTFLADKTPGVVVGYAFDGFPVKAPYEACTTGADCVNGVREIVSSYKYVGTGAYSTEQASTANSYVAGYNGSTLDSCNGKTDSSGNYAYYATKAYPYYIGCYTGTPTANGTTGAASTGTTGAAPNGPPPGR